jgi:glucose-1-phosphate thymidylyltransferase
MNKHLLPLGNEPMIYHGIRQLVSAEIKDILVITSEDHIHKMKNQLGDGSGLSCRLTYEIQSEAKGIAHGVLLAERFADKGPITVILGDNVATHSIHPYVERFRKQKMGAKILLKPVEHPERFGIAILDNLKIVHIVEKPKISWGSQHAVVGIYMYDENIFDLIRETLPREDIEWDLTDVNNLYNQQGQLTYEFLEGPWVDAGTVESYQYANELILGINNQIIRGYRI